MKLEPLGLFAVSVSENPVEADTVALRGEDHMLSEHRAKATQNTDVERLWP